MWILTASITCLALIIAGASSARMLLGLDQGGFTLNAAIHAIISLNASLRHKEHFWLVLAKNYVHAIVFCVVACITVGLLWKHYVFSAFVVFVLFLLHLHALFKRGCGMHAFPAVVTNLFDWGNEDTCDVDWWEDPADLTTLEMDIMDYIRFITVDLKPKKREEIWSMTGGDRQLGFTAVRYHLSFCGYAASAASLRTPAYPNQVHDILTSVIDEMMRHHTWSYMPVYWSGEDAAPFKCRENVMWSGHVLHLAALLEAQTGDDRYRKPGGLVAVGKDGEKHVSDVMSLAQLTADAMRHNPIGGMPCEPGLVFFQCQNHPHVAFRLLEGICLGVDFSDVRRRFEDIAFKQMRSPTDVGAFKLLVKSREGMASSEGVLRGWVG